MNQHVITSPDKESTVVIDKGELISYSKFGEELIHQKGNPGWRNADTEMFPIIGPTQDNDFRVETERGEALQDQHGLLRELAYDVVNETDHSVIYSKSYEKNTPVTNSKYPDKSNKELVSWPYSFLFTKKFSLTDDALRIEFLVEGEPGMPYMLGYHPAFKLSGENTERFISNMKQMTLQDILDVGSIAFPALKCEEISMIKENGYNIRISTKGFHNFMLWTEVTNMVCIEPITAYPYTDKKALGKELFKTCSGFDSFEVVIEAY
ncbi:MAG: aldose 1-epimerase [Flavobacteriales bacterium]|nr:aldose 1-epimerase [Flavobacteriales bacterium]